MKVIQAATKKQRRQYISLQDSKLHMQYVCDGNNKKSSNGYRTAFFLRNKSLGHFRCRAQKT